MVAVAVVVGVVVGVAVAVAVGVAGAVVVAVVVGVVVGVAVAVAVGVAGAVVVAVMTGGPLILGFSARVLGVPAPQGSKTLMPNRRMVESSRKVGPWRDAVATAAMVAHFGCPPLDGPLRLDAEFRLPMPQSRPKRVRERGWAWRDRTPDLDKLLRSTCDGLTAAGVIVDDARIVSSAATKREVTGWTGAWLTLRPIDPDDPERAA